MQTVSTKRLLVKLVNTKKHDLKLRTDLYDPLESWQEFDLEKIDRRPWDLFCIEDGVKRMH